MTRMKWLWTAFDVHPTAQVGGKEGKPQERLQQRNCNDPTTTPNATKCFNKALVKVILLGTTTTTALQVLYLQTV